MALNPGNIASLSFVPGSTVTFQIITTNAAPFAGFFVGLFYNISVLTNPHVDYANNVLDAPGNPATVLSECVNGASLTGSGNVCTPDISVDRIGVLSLQLVTTPPLGNTPTPNGILFSVAFTVAVAGFSPIHFVKALLGTEPNGAFLPVVTNDGYFTNMDCGGVLCRPPIVILSAPQTAVIGNSVSFDASGSKSQNLNGQITGYNWVWASGLNLVYQTTTSPIVTHTFSLIGPWTVTLAIEDNYGISAIETLLINVTRDQSRISVSMFFTDPSFNYLPSRSFGGVFQPTVNVTIANGVVRNVAPRIVLAWVNVTNSGATPLQSMRLLLFFQLFGWDINPSWTPSHAAIHVYYANASSFANNPEITQPSTISAPIGGDFVQLSINNFNLTGIGHPLLPGQSILLSVRLGYNPIGESQSVSTYPRLYNFGSGAVAYTQSGLSGNSASAGTYSGLVALATSKGNVGHPATII